MYSMDSIDGMAYHICFSPGQDIAGHRGPKERDKPHGLVQRTDNPHSEQQHDAGVGHGRLQSSAWYI